LSAGYESRECEHALSQPQICFHWFSRLEFKIKEGLS